MVFQVLERGVFMKINTDSLGRIVIPKAIRDSKGIRAHDMLNIVEEQDSIIIKKVIYDVDVEKFIKDFILFRFGAEYSDILLSKVSLKEIERMLNDYLEKLLKHTETL